MRMNDGEQQIGDVWIERRGEGSLESFPSHEVSWVIGFSEKETGDFSRFVSNSSESSVSP